MNKLVRGVCSWEQTIEEVCSSRTSRMYQSIMGLPGPRRAGNSHEIEDA